MLVICRLKFILAAATIWITLLLSLPQQAAGAARIVINKGTNQLAFFMDGILLDVFPVATGRQPGYTPEGDWRIVVKQVYPAWRNPAGGPLIPGGVPANPLGPRWLGLNARGTGGSSYGVHGNNNTSSIGTYASSGCIRMYNDDILWLYDRAPLGTQVSIINSQENLNDWQNTVRVTVNGSVPQYEPHLGPVRAGDATCLPVRPLAAAMGYQLYWDEASHFLTLANFEREITAKPGSDRVTVNNQVYMAGKAPFILADRIFVTIDFLERFMGAEICPEEGGRSLDLKLPVNTAHSGLARYHLSLRVNGKGIDLPEELAPLREGRNVLVPARAFCTAAGAAVSWNEAAKSVEIVNRASRVLIPVNGSPPLLDGVVTATRANIRVIDGTSYVNLSFLTGVFGFLADLDKEARVLNITTDFTRVLSGPGSV
ncbi:MAG: putative L,D-transpeptidase YkuD [Firmicutes bacterium ADurb.Bin456]|nr:MAG: putative L,D-transpeptidase YkuD [Firmicutes bacterium ADurb.Bin456]